VTETEYDGEGRVIKQIDGNKHATEYIRNAVGEVTEVIDPLKRKTKRNTTRRGT
jgi:YD repeat-containing protein